MADYPKYAVLKGHEVVPIGSQAKWGASFDYAARRVAHDTIGEARVSTVFLGLNSSFGEGPPLWFETLVFGGEFDDEIHRYTTWDEAVEGHKNMVRRVGRSKLFFRVWRRFLGNLWLSGDES